MRFLQILSVLAAVAVIAIVATRSPDAPPPPRTLPQPARDPRVAELTERIGSMEHRLQQLHTLLRNEIVRRPTPPQPAPARADTAASGADTRRADRKAPVSIARLKTRARALALDSEKTLEALDAWASVAAHATDPRVKAEAWTEHGQVHRKLHQYREAARSWQKAVEAAGLHTPEGQAASFLLGHAQGRYDIHEAYKTFERLSGTPGVAKPLAASARLSMAIYARAVGENAVARREFERVVSDFEGDRDQHYRELARVASERLAEMD